MRSFWAPLIKVLSGSTQPAKTLQPKVKEAIMAMEHQESVKQSDFPKRKDDDFWKFPIWFNPFSLNS